jgi:hypothetical protein
VGDTKSKTERDTNLVERLTGSHHHKTTIRDGKDCVEGLGRTPKEAEERASKRWEDRKKK